MKETLDFIVIGAQKSGTTSLFEYLTRHPELSLPAGKELPFFSDRDARERGWSDYLRKAFAFAEPDSRWGTVTPQYMVGGLLDTPNPSPDGILHDERTVPLRIHEQIPQVRLIAILRDPVERALSHHRMATMEGFEQRAFDQAIEQLLQTSALEAARRSPQEETGYVVWGEYGRILSGYLEVFPRAQILVLFTQDLELAPEQLLARVHEFLGVSSDTMPENLGRRYRTGGSERRFSWLRPYAIQRAITEQNTMRTLWHKLPERTRRRIDRQFMRAAYGFDLWNRRGAHTTKDPDPATMKRLREHFAADTGRLEAEFQLTAPWHEPAKLEVSEPPPVASPTPLPPSEPEKPTPPRYSAVKRMLASAAATALLQVASLVLGFATSVVIARTLGRDEYGRYVFALAWASLLIIPAVLGLDRFLVRGIAVYEEQGNWALMRGLLRRTNQALILTSLLIAGVGVLIALEWLSHPLRWPFCVAMLLVPFTALTLARQATMQALGRTLTGQLPEYALRPVLILAGVGGLALVGKGALTASSALAANVTGVAVAFALGALLLRRALPAAMRSAKASYATSEWLRASLPMMLINGIWAANSYVTTLAVGTLSGTRGAGVYSVAQRGAELIVVLLLAANMPLAPAIAKLHTRGDRAGLEHTTERVAQATLLVSAPLAGVLIVFPGLYLGIFGASFRSGATALTILAVGQLVNAAVGPAGNVLLMTGHERAAMRGIGVGLLVNLVLALALVPGLGVTGGAIAFASSLILWNVVLVVLARRRVGINATAFRRLAMARTAPDERG